MPALDGTRLQVSSRSSPARIVPANQVFTYAVSPPFGPSLRTQIGRVGVGLAGRHVALPERRRRVAPLGLGRDRHRHVAQRLVVRIAHAQLQLDALADVLHPRERRATTSTRNVALGLVGVLAPRRRQQPAAAASDGQEHDAAHRQRRTYHAVAA